MLDNGVQHSPTPVLNGNETVLVVDDIESIRNLLKDTLSKYGYTVICAEDGRDGLKKFRENRDKIHVSLLDVVMPKLDGLELFKEIKKLESNAKVLFMSGYNEILEKYNLQGNIKCISKPFLIKTLLKEMREVLDKR